MNPLVAQKKFLRNIKGMSGGQWGTGFIEGVIAFRNFMQREKFKLIRPKPANRKAK